MSFSYQIGLLAEVRLVIVLILMLILPGWALLLFVPDWRKWNTLSRWCLAIGLSISIYPVLFYMARALVPWLSLGPYKMGALLLGCAVIILWKLRRELREQVLFDRLEWLAITIFGMTLFTRYWIIRDAPFPPSTDSVHHALLTQLTALHGQLPFTLELNFPIPLDMYHLGFYALTATAQNLAVVPPHTAVLWTAQVLNGLCGLGVYFVLDQRSGRLAALVGSIVVGFLSFQPALLVSYGRFTPVASQVILLIAWLMTWNALELWRREGSPNYKILIGNTAVAALLNAAVFLFHFRVAGYYLPLLLITAIWELYQAYRLGRMQWAGAGLGVTGALALLLIAPALLPSLRAYWQWAGQMAALSPIEADQLRAGAYEFSWINIKVSGARPWLLTLMLVSTCLGIWRRQPIVIVSVIWILALWLIGNAYRLEIPLLRFTNMIAILFALYLPIGLIVGAAIEEIPRLIGITYRPFAYYSLIVTFLLGGVIGGRARAVEILPEYYFVTPEDLPAMAWIEKNTPPDALFAISTKMYLSEILIGTDAGYWIPYFTGRHTTTSVMLFGLAAPQYRQQVSEMSQAAERLASDPTALNDLRRMGVSYVYVGKKANAFGPSLDPVLLAQLPGVKRVYQQEGVTILKIDFAATEQNKP